MNLINVDVQTDGKETLVMNVSSYLDASMEVVRIVLQTKVCQTLVIVTKGGLGLFATKPFVPKTVVPPMDIAIRYFLGKFFFMSKYFDFYYSLMSAIVKLAGKVNTARNVYHFGIVLTREKMHAKNPMTAFATRAIMMLDALLLLENNVKYLKNTLRC